MPKKAREMTPKEASLFSQMQKLAKQANRRILNIERLTGESETFATKTLTDYLSADYINAMTKSGRISVKSNYTLMQMQGIIKATNDFLKSEYSTIKGIKAEAKRIAEKEKVPLTFSQINVIFQLQHTYKWIYDYISPSEFWSIARTCVENHKDYDYFENALANHSEALRKELLEDERIDSSLRKQLKYLYEYIQGMNV